MPVIYHGTPMAPRAALEAVLPGRAACVSFYRPDNIDAVSAICPDIMLDNGAFSFWKQSMKARAEWDEADRDWTPYYRWLEKHLFQPGRWAVIPDRPGAPSQLNDALLNDNPFGTELMSPLWHMDASVSRLAKLCDTYARVCLGWVGTGEDSAVGCDAYRRKMDEVAALFGNNWPTIHMMRGVAVARDYPFHQRRQHQPRPERLAIRLDGWGDTLGTVRKVARAPALRRQIGGPSPCAS